MRISGSNSVAMSRCLPLGPNGFSLSRVHHRILLSFCLARYLLKTHLSESVPLLLNPHCSYRAWASSLKLQAPLLRPQFPN